MTVTCVFCGWRTAAGETAYCGECGALLPLEEPPRTGRHQWNPGRLVPPGLIPGRVLPEGARMAVAIVAIVVVVSGVAIALPSLLTPLANGGPQPQQAAGQQTVSPLATMSFPPAIEPSPAVSTARAAPAASKAAQIKPAWPGPGRTGVPSGQSLALINGDYHARINGEVVEAKHITGTLWVEAAHVVVRNSQIDESIGEPDQVAGPSFTVSDTTVGPVSGCAPGSAVGNHDYSAARVWIRNSARGFEIGGNNVSVSDSVAVACGDDGHPLFAYCPDGACGPVEVRHNVFDTRNAGGTGAVYLDDKNLRGVTLRDNLIAGGGYTMFLKWKAGPRWAATGTKIVNGSWEYGPITTGGTCAQIDWGGTALVTVDGSYDITGSGLDLACVD